MVKQYACDAIQSIGLTIDLNGIETGIFGNGIGTQWLTRAVQISRTICIAEYLTAAGKIKPSLKSSKASHLKQVNRTINDAFKRVNRLSERQAYRRLGSKIINFILS